MDVEADFYSDWVDFLRKQLASMGYVIEATATQQDVSFMFFNAVKRRIEPRPRQVREATTFKCPPAHVAGYERLRGGIERGDDLGPYLSRWLTSATFNDRMLNDWGFYHLHLGESVDRSGFIERTGDLLYAVFRPDACYCLAVLPHRNWTNQELMRALHRDWPEVLEPYRLRGITGPELSEEERRQLRRANVNVPISLEGNVYAPPGGGSASSGLSTRVVIEADRYAWWVRKMEKWARENAADIAAGYHAQSGRALSSPMQLRFELDYNGRPYAIDVAQRVRFYLSEETF